MRRVKHMLTLGLSTIVLSLSAQHDAKVEALLKQMTLEEKVGQMAQYTIDVIGREAKPSLRPTEVPGESYDHFEFDPVKFELVLGKMKVGSILNTTNNKAQTTPKRPGF